MGSLSRWFPGPRDALVAAVVVGTINAALNAVLTVAVRVSWDPEDVNSVGQEATVGLITFFGGVVLVLTCLLTGLPQRRGSVQVLAAVALSVAFGAVRTILDQAVLPIAGDTTGVVILLGVSSVASLVVASPALLVSVLVARRRAEQDAREAEQVRNRAATAALEADEAQLRQEVAEHLHGTVQNRLVVVGAGLDQLAAESEAEGRPDRAETLRSWAQMIDTVRERDVREISHQVFPTGLDIGLAQGLGLLLDRLPTSVATSVHLGDGVREADEGLSIADRLLIAATVEEGLTNALRHGHATRVDLGLAVRDGTLTTTLRDNGDGLPGHGVQESGLLRHRARIDARGGRIDLAPGESEGTVLSVSVPLD